MSDQPNHPQYGRNHYRDLNTARFLARRIHSDYRTYTTHNQSPDELRQYAKGQSGVWSGRADEHARYAATELEEVRRLLSAEQYPDPRALAEAVAEYAHHCHMETTFRTIHFFAEESESDDSES